ncbi:unnamed protein product [Closterium sp. Yama58-4]|nr:unnamed protein product [Closterium sp. Yama58-4]
MAAAVPRRCRTISSGQLKEIDSRVSVESVVPHSAHWEKYAALGARCAFIWPEPPDLSRGGSECIPRQKSRSRGQRNTIFSRRSLVRILQEEGVWNEAAWYSYYAAEESSEATEGCVVAAETSDDAAGFSSEASVDHSGPTEGLAEGERDSNDSAGDSSDMSSRTESRLSSSFSTSAVEGSIIYHRLYSTGEYIDFSSQFSFGLTWANVTREVLSGVYSNLKKGGNGCSGTAAIVSTGVAADMGVAVDADLAAALDADVGFAVAAGVDVAVDADVGAAMNADVGGAVDADVGVFVDADAGAVMNADVGAAVDPGMGAAMGPTAGTALSLAAAVLLFAGSAQQCCLQAQLCCLLAQLFCLLAQQCCLQRRIQPREKQQPVPSQTMRELLR